MNIGVADRDAEARGGCESPRRVRNMHGAKMMSSRANARAPLALKARGRSEKVRSVTGRARRAGVARAAQDDLTPEKLMQKYDEISYKIPPIVTAATVPVVGLSLLCKTLTGHGCLLYTSPSPRDKRQSRMPSSA